MAHLVDGIVDGRVLFNIGVRGRDIGLGLIVIIVGDKILDRIMGEKFPELGKELRGQGLVGRQHQGRSLHPGNDLGHGKGLAAAGDAEQNLVTQPLFDAVDQLFDGPGLVSGRGEFTDKLKRGIHDRQRYPERL